MVRARLLGIQHSTAKILTFLDSHCECTEGWLEPLLERIVRDPTNVVCPVIDAIDHNTFEYVYKGGLKINIGGFTWDLLFKWRPIPEREKQRRKHLSEPLFTPTMAGGLFSIDRDFFEKLGKYDDGLEIWGGENVELSLKVWMCGGKLEIIPCSHVGHIFRRTTPYTMIPGVDVARRNTVRVAEVWLDDYKEFFFMRIGYAKGDYGDVSSRIELKKSLNCKNFKWYLENIFPELPIPNQAIAQGYIKNLGFGGETCIDASHSENDVGTFVRLFKCHYLGFNQVS